MWYLFQIRAIFLYYSFESGPPAKFNEMILKGTLIFCSRIICSSPPLVEKQFVLCKLEARPSLPRPPAVEAGFVGGQIRKVWTEAMDERDALEVGVAIVPLVSCMSQRPECTHSKELLALLDNVSVSAGATETEDSTHMESMCGGSPSSELRTSGVFPFWEGVQKFLDHEKERRTQKKRWQRTSNAGDEYRITGKRRINGAGDYVGRGLSSLESSISKGSGGERSLGSGSDRKVMPVPAELEAWKYVRLMKRQRHALLAGEYAAGSGESQSLNGRNNSSEG